MGIVERWEENNLRVQNQLSFAGRIIKEIGVHSQGKYLRDPFQPAPEGDKFVMLCCHVSFAVIS